jgi:hypothetical protein
MKVPVSTEWCSWCDRERKVNKVVNKCICGKTLIACNQCIGEDCYRCGDKASHFKQRK